MRTVPDVLAMKQLRCPEQALVDDPGEGLPREAARNQGNEMHLVARVGKIPLHMRETVSIFARGDMAGKGSETGNLHLAVSHSTRQIAVRRKRRCIGG